MEPNIPQIRNRLLELKNQYNAEELFPTKHPDASKLIHSNPYAFCVATCLDRGTKADIIWTIPYWISQITGHFDPKRFYEMSVEEITEIFRRLPKKPRYINAAPNTFTFITRKVEEEYGGNAYHMWENKRAAEVKETFMSVNGVGNGIANMALLLIESMYDFRFPDLDHRVMDIKPDVHTIRVLYRLGVAATKQENEAIRAARRINPSYPGEIDGPLWLLGRKLCHATNPECDRCQMNTVCSRIEV